MYASLNDDTHIANRIPQTEYICRTFHETLPDERLSSVTKSVMKAL
jgi:hypothetical protein